MSQECVGFCGEAAEVMETGVNRCRLSGPPHAVLGASQPPGSHLTLIKLQFISNLALTVSYCSLPPGFLSLFNPHGGSTGRTNVWTQRISSARLEAEDLGVVGYGRRSPHSIAPLICPPDMWEALKGSPELCKA